MSDRRVFVAQLLGAGLALPSLRGGAFRELARATEIAEHRPAARLADDESYWGQIQRAFDLDQTMVNLNNGGCSPAPTHVLEQMIRDLRFSNELPVEHMWRTLEPRSNRCVASSPASWGATPRSWPSRATPAKRTRR